VTPVHVAAWALTAAALVLLAGAVRDIRRDRSRSALRLIAAGLACNAGSAALGRQWVTVVVAVAGAALIASLRGAR
jgi:hypothetical protein